MYIQSIAIRNQSLTTERIARLNSKKIRNIIFLLLPLIYIAIITIPTRDKIEQKIISSSIFTIETTKSVIEPIIEIMYPSPPSWIPIEYVLFIMKECNKSGVPYLLIFKLIECESGWLQKARHINIDPDTGEIVSIDYGRMQINSLNFKEFIAKFKDSNRKANSYDLVNNPYDNTQIGIRHLADLYHKFNSWTLAVTAYNAGTLNTMKGNISARTRKHVNRVIPIENWWTFPETVRIIRKNS